MDFRPGFMDEILRYQKEPASRPKERRIDLEIFSGLFEQVTKVMPLEIFVAKLIDCKTDDKKVELVEPFFNWTPESPSNPRFKKSSEACLAYCKRTREAPTKTDCMKMVNMMFALAEDEGDLTLANLMRFTFLNKAGDYTGALQAIKNVVNSPVPPKSSSLFPSLSRDTVIAMETSAEAKVKEQAAQSKIQKEAFKKEIAERKKFMRNLFTLKNPNPVAPSLEDFVEIKSNSSHGRFLVVNKDVLMGTTVLVEKPAVAAPFQEPFNLGVVHCHHCFKKNFNLIPCPNCVFALFCDEKCMKAAENYHQFECPAFPDLHAIVMGLYSTFYSAGSNMPANWIPVFKLISSLGPNRLFQIFQEEKNQKIDPTKSQNPNEIAGFDPVTKMYDPKSYETICHLHRYFIKGSLFPTVAALCLVKILEVKCDFFEKLDPDSDVDSKTKKTKTKTKLEFQDFLAKRMLSHFESFRRNSFHWDEIDSLEGIRLADTKRKENPVEIPEITTAELGPTIYPTASLLSHSCVPNITRFFNLSHAEVAFVSQRSLKKGEELYVSYGPHYSSEGKEGRQETLDFYNFKCDCVACSENWPTTNEQMMTMMMTRMNMSVGSTCPPFCCPRCYDDLKTKGEGNALAEMKKRKGEMDWSKISLKPESGFKCANCNQKYSKESLFSEFVSQFTTLSNVSSLLTKNKPLEAIEIVKKASEFYHSKMIPPDVSMATCFDSFEKAVMNIVHFSPEY